VTEVPLREVDRRVTQIEVELGKHGDRLRHIEHSQAVQGADLRTIGQDVQEIKQDIKRVLWAVILAVVAAVMGFILQGGLSR
jgi:glycosyltransferase A (GT-A) superfamily protein (DUF2064 family)